jgi:hypothetical protein
MLAILVMGLPLKVSAQQPAAPPTHSLANPVVQSFRAFSTHYGDWLVAALDSIPANRYGYRPTSPQQTVGTVAEHVEGANYGLCTVIGNLKPPMAAADSAIADTVKAKWPKDTLVARLRASLAFCDSAMARSSDAALDDSVPTGPPNNLKIVRAQFLLAFVTDLAEHYSQIASYMRLIGMVPPSALPRPGH